MQMAHPGLPEFDYIRPGTLMEASRFLADHPDEARIFLGGTDMFVRMRDGAWTAKYLVDVKGLHGTNELHYSSAHGLVVGAAVNMNRLISSPDVQNYYQLLVEAAHSVASYQLRTRATIIGNICNASPAGDTTGACIVLGGILKVHGLNGYREESLSTFFKGAGKTILKPGDVVTSIHFPVPQEGAAGKYLKLGRNAIGDLSIVGVTVFGYRDNNTVSGYRFKIALASVAPIPFVPVQAEAVLAEKPISKETVDEAAQFAMDACTPIDDIRGGAKYRKQMVRNLTRNGLHEVISRLGLKI
ncbi:MAG TPA: xanthine dehydrogenase family protein subunit M [Anaerolineaceae bacterium]|nr:xanthine dehydrogenase family protein subunit M [Anaerolineaceae bacterium]